MKIPALAKAGAGGLHIKIDLDIFKDGGTKMNEYRDWREKMQEKFNKFPIGAAYSDKQLHEEMDRLGVKSTDELVQLEYGTFIRKSDKKAYLDLAEEIDSSFEKGLKDYDFVYDMFLTELADHEYCITGDLRETLDACGLAIEDIAKNAMYREALKAAKEEYFKNVIY